VNAAEDRRLRVVVCGTTFGQVYLEAFRTPGLPLTAAGILARGSERSRACARHYDLPLFTEVGQLPDDIDAACVVVRSGLLGGRGTELAMDLMARGVHVLQEHPLHHDELAGCLRAARRNHVVYGLNSFYVHLEPVRRFIAAARTLLRLQPPEYVDAVCGFQVAYALLDIIGEVLTRVRPWSLAIPSPPVVPTPPFRSLDGTIAGVPVTLRIQNQLNSDDPDDHTHLLHRITVGTAGGNLTLATTHGPLIWNARPRIPREVRSAGADALYASGTSARTADPSAMILGAANAPGDRAIFGSVWPAGVARALLGFRDSVIEGEDPMRRGQYHLALCRLWQDITTRLGPPDLVSGGASPMLSAEDLALVAKAARSPDPVG
jgi:pyochelin biosynthetic protein PchG